MPYKVHKLPGGKYCVIKKNELETMSGPPDEARDDTGKWTSGNGSSGGSQLKGTPKNPVTTKSSKGGYNYTNVDYGNKVAGSVFPKNPSSPSQPQSSNSPSSSLGSGVPKVSSGISPQKKAEIAKRLHASQTRTKTSSGNATGKSNASGQTEYQWPSGTEPKPYKMTSDDHRRAYGLGNAVK